MFFNKILGYRFKPVSIISNYLKLYSSISTRLSYDSDIVSKFVRKLSVLYEKDKTKLIKTFVHYDFAQLENIYNFHNYLHKTENEIEELRCLLEDENPHEKEMRSMLEIEMEELQKNFKQSKEEFPSILSLKEGEMIQEVLFELNAGVGGQEAMLFTNQLFSMYQHFFKFKNWQAEVITCEASELGGMKHATLSVCGVNAYKRLRFEGGVHRVQRTPSTEKSGRLHTSAVSVAVTLQPSEVDVELNVKDLRVETCRSSGKGGQHVNTTDSAVRIVHLPTGIAAESQKERSQIKNREHALKMLRSRIYEKLNNEMTQQYSADRKLQVGSGDRNEKIRTYNFKDDRVTDHRINLSLFGIVDFLNGTRKLDEIQNSLEQSYHTELLIEKITQLVKTE